MAIDLGGGGISGTGGSASLTGGGDGAQWDGDARSHWDYQLENLVDRLVETVVWTGSLEKLLAETEGIYIGRYGGSFHTLLSDPDTVACTKIRIRRSKGGICTLTATNVKVKGYILSSIDFVEIAKPIKLWRQDLEDAAARPNLLAIESWQQYKENGDEASYAEYKCDVTVDGTRKTELADVNENTLELAKLIREKGIDSYTMHAPVVTHTTTYTKFPEGCGRWLDTYGSSFDPPDVLGAYTYLDADFVGKVAAGLADVKKWLCIADRSTPNADGTFTRVMQYQGCTDVNDKLYFNLEAGSGT